MRNGTAWTPEPRALFDTLCGIHGSSGETRVPPTGVGIRGWGTTTLLILLPATADRRDLRAIVRSGVVRKITTGFARGREVQLRLETDPLRKARPAEQFWNQHEQIIASRAGRVEEGAGGVNPPLVQFIAAPAPSLSRRGTYPLHNPEDRHGRATWSQEPDQL